MKTTRIQTVFNKVVVVITALILFTASAQAQNSEKCKSAYKEKFTKNLIAGILQSNEGLKNSAIYFAGHYKMKGTTDALIQQLKKEESAKTRRLIVYSLFMIGEEKGISAIYELAADERDEYIRTGFSEVINEFEPQENVAAYSSDRQ